jgi:hypothetical protein
MRRQCALEPPNFPGAIRAPLVWRSNNSYQVGYVTNDRNGLSPAPFGAEFQPFMGVTSLISLAVTRDLAAIDAAVAGTHVGRGRQLPESRALDRARFESSRQTPPSSFCLYLHAEVKTRNHPAGCGPLPTKGQCDKE